MRSLDSDLKQDEPKPEFGLQNPCSSVFHPWLSSAWTRRGPRWPWAQATHRTPCIRAPSTSSPAHRSTAPPPKALWWRTFGIPPLESDKLRRSRACRVALWLNALALAVLLLPVPNLLLGPHPPPRAREAAMVLL